MTGFFKKVRFEEGKIVKEDAVVKVASGRRVPKGHIMMDGKIVALRDSVESGDTLDEERDNRNENSESIEIAEEPKSVDYHAITDDIYEMTADKIVSGLMSEFAIYENTEFIEIGEQGGLIKRAELSDAYDQVSVMRKQVNELIKKYCNGFSYYNYKTDYQNGYTHGHLEMLNIRSRVDYSKLLEGSLVRSGLVSEKDVNYMFGDVKFLLNKMMTTESEMADAMKDMDVVKDAYYSTKVLGTELDMFGRTYKMINKLNVEDVFENINNEILPDVKVVITETGVYIFWDIKLDNENNVKVTSEGIVYYRNGVEWVRPYSSTHMNRRISYLLGNLTPLIRKKLGKNVKVQAVGLVSKQVEHIDNLSSRKVITLANLYDAVYDDVGGILLSEEDMEEVFNLLGSMNKEQDLIEFADISNELKTWENNLKCCSKFLAMRAYIRNFERD